MSKKKVALISGINGQDGSYLAEFLLEKGYEVWGTVKRNSVAENQTSRLDEIYPQLLGKLQYADLTDLASLNLSYTTMSTRRNLQFSSAKSRSNFI